MPFTRKTSVTYRDHILEALRADIVAGRLLPGNKMPPLRALSARFHASLFPIRQAMAQLETEGYVVRRHGSGIYVLPRQPVFQMTDSVVLCMDATGHVYGDLTQFLLDRLHDLGLFASVLDMGHGNAQELLKRGLHSEARFLIFTGGTGFPWDALHATATARKHLIAVVSCETNDATLGAHCIVVDHGTGSRALATHLWERGHRRVLFAGPVDMIERASAWNGRGVCGVLQNVSGTGLPSMWARRGGQLMPFRSHHDLTKGPQCDETQLLALLNGADAPSAIVGLRDVDAWDARDVLHRRAPDVLARLEFVGNGDTPWSRTSHPPFTTLNWNLNQIADLTGQLIRDLAAGKKYAHPVMHFVPSRLEARGELRRAD